MTDSSFKEQRIRKITNLYYSNPEVQKAIFEFSKNREISPSYMMEHFGKRPDTFQYMGDIFEMVKKGATSFHCSEELWEDPLKLETGMSESDSNNLRIGWDLLIDLDCKWIDYSKKAAAAIINVFKKHNIKNFGIKFSGSKGFHILLPWEAFPKKVGEEQTKNLFPELPRKLVSYIRFKAEEEMRNALPEDFYNQFKDVEIKKGIKCNKCKEVASEYIKITHFCPKCHRQELRKVPKDSSIDFKCPDCKIAFEVRDSQPIYLCTKCNIFSDKDDNNFSRQVEVDLFELMGLDLVLVSPRHLFRMPYSLHEKTALASIVIDPDKLHEFDITDANPLKIKIKDFTPKAIPEEASELVREALDWEKQLNNGESEEKIKGKYADFKPIILKNIQDSQFPPCITSILKGLKDGRKRAVFILLNFFRSIGMDKEELEKKIFDWNEKNQPPLKKGYIISQLYASYKRKPLMPPNCKEYYQGLGICMPDEFCLATKNPVNYVVKKNLSANKKKSNKFKKNN